MTIILKLITFEIKSYIWKKAMCMYKQTYHIFPRSSELYKILQYNTLQFQHKVDINFIHVYKWLIGKAEKVVFIHTGIVHQKWFVRMKNIRLKSGISFSFKWKQSNHSRARVLIFFYNFSVFISKCYGLALACVWELCSTACQNVHIDIPHSTSIVAAWRDMICQQSTPWAAYLTICINVKVTWGTCRDKENVFLGR